MTAISPSNEVQYLKCTCPPNSLFTNGKTYKARLSENGRIYYLQDDLGRERILVAITSDQQETSFIVRNLWPHGPITRAYFNLTQDA